METAIAKMASSSIGEKVKALELELLVTSKRAIILKDALEDARQQRALLTAYVAEQMVLGTDYGVIPGTKGAPSLLKPGAEKLLELFRCTPKFHLVEKTEDWEKGFFNYMFRARVTSRDSDAVLAEGFGSANSREGRYRWRNAKPKCPRCEKETINRSEEGFYCWRKKGGCGAKFALNDTSITGQPQGQVENDDIATLANTILKMAKKRALVDAAIALARCSDMFTQDIEDLVDVGQQIPDDGQAQASNGGSAQQFSPPPQQEENPFPPDGPPGPPPEAPKQQQRPPASPAQLRTRALRIWSAKQKQGLTIEGFRTWTTTGLGHTRPQPEWTEADVEKLETALAREASKS